MTAVPADVDRTGAVLGAWTAYRALLRWTLAQIGAMLPLLVVVQVALAAGVVVGFGLLVPDIDAATATMLSTGAPTMLVMVLGLVVVPQGVARARLDGSFAFLRALPVPRPLVLAAELTVWTLVAAPGVVAALVVARWRYGVELVVDPPLLLGALLLVVLTATCVGYAIAVTLPPMIAQLLTQVLVFFVLLFSPISFPADQLPGWLQAVHDVLPIRAAADLVRAGLVADVHAASARDLVTVAVWCAASASLAVRSLVRRG